MIVALLVRRRLLLWVVLLEGLVDPLRYLLLRAGRPAALYEVLVLAIRKGVREEVGACVASSGVEEALPHEVDSLSDLRSALHPSST